MHYPKQIAFGEEGSVLVGGSDHGVVYFFDTTTGCPLDLLHHSDCSLVQTIMVSQLIVIWTSVTEIGQTHSKDKHHMIVTATSNPWNFSKADICLWVYIEPTEK